MVATYSTTVTDGRTSTGICEDGKSTYTSPDAQMLYGNSPPRKTQKLLGNASIVIDRFGKRGWTTYREPQTPLPGDGLYGHRDGYNVLYGDWSARWMGDPQQRWIWTSVGFGLIDTSSMMHMNSSGVYPGFGTSASAGVQAWLYFDKSNGLAGAVTPSCNP
jgi:hypothetical protein